MPLSPCTFSRTSLLGLLDLQECGAVSLFDFFMSYDRKLNTNDETNLGLMTKLSNNILTGGGGSSPGHDTTGFDV